MTKTPTPNLSGSTEGYRPLTEGYQPGSQVFQKGFMPLATRQPPPPKGGSGASKPASVSNPKK